MSKPARDFSKTACVRKTRALCKVMEALAALDADGRAFVLATATARLGVRITAPGPEKPAKKAVDKTHWFSDTQPFGPRNLDC